MNTAFAEYKYKGVFHMTKEEIYEKLQTEIKIRGLSPGTNYTYKNAIELFLNWAGKPLETLEEADFRNYLLFLINRGDLSILCFRYPYLANNFKT